MENNIVGYRFHPTGEELINHYLKNKILDRPWFVEDAINEINICNYDPRSLPSLSKIKSKDLVWYFFTPRELASGKKKGTKRTTVSGYWKATGVDRKIKDKRGIREIGIKKTLVYYQGRVPNGVWTPWVMHEYHITCLPQDQRNYVICQVMYKGEEGDIMYGHNNTSEAQPSGSLVCNSNTVREINTSPEVEQPSEYHFNGLSVDDLLIPMNELEDVGFNPDKFFSGYNNNNNNNYHLNMQPQTSCDYEFWNRVNAYNGEAFEDVFSNPELIMQENRNNHMAKKPIQGIIVDCGSDSDAESISATSYQGTSSPNDSVGSSNKYFPSCSSSDSSKDLQTPEDPSIKLRNRESQLKRRTILAKQEVKEGKSKAVYTSMARTRRNGLFITEEAFKVKSPRYVYLMNLIVCLTLLAALLATSYRFY